jgi:phosphatidylethanolamine/phosphatidyl-N-methylethanolamine N-methyltransferase
MLKDLGLFLGEFLSNFHATGAVAPSSPALARAILKPLQHRPNRPIKVLEVGPGTGAFTFQILKHLRPEDALQIYELNPKFHAHLEGKLAPWLSAAQGVKVSLLNRDIRRLPAGMTFDYIISGLPFANFNSGQVAEIMNLYLSHLAREGVLSYFEYLIPHRLRLRFMRAADRKRMLWLSKRLATYARKHQVLSSRVWFNLPPARARHFKKNLL